MKMKLKAGFKPRDFVVVCNKDDDEVIATYMSEFKGRDYFHVRTIYQEDKTGDWCPARDFQFQPNWLGSFARILARLPWSNRTEVNSRNRPRIQSCEVGLRRRHSARRYVAAES
jgi:hypothetical protein